VHVDEEDEEDEEDGRGNDERVVSVFVIARPGSETRVGVDVHQSSYHARTLNR